MLGFWYQEKWNFCLVVIEFPFARVHAFLHTWPQDHSRYHQHKYKSLPTQFTTLEKARVFPLTPLLLFPLWPGISPWHTVHCCAQLLLVSFQHTSQRGNTWLANTDSLQQSMSYHSLLLCEHQRHRPEPIAPNMILQERGMRWGQFHLFMLASSVNSNLHTDKILPL